VVKIGLLGSGFVADFYMEGLRDVPGTQVVANYSRSDERAKEFDARFDGQQRAIDIALAAVKRLAARIDGERQSVEDATDRYVDLEARLKTLRGTEDELRALLAESRRRESKVDDIMTVYQRLTEIRSQIEEIQGKLAAIEQLAALSTLNVTLYPTEAARPVSPDGWNPGDTVRTSARSLVVVLHFLGDLAIWLLVVALPVTAILFAVALAGRWSLRRLRRGRPVAAGA